VKSLQPLLKSAGKVARISYAATCQSDDPLRIPKVDMQEPPPSETGSAAVRAMFQNDKTVVVTEEPRGIIRIRIGESQDEILQTRISHLSLNLLDQYNAPFARDALLGNEDMGAAIKRLGLDPLVFIYGYLAQSPAPGLPHLASSMTDVTADQVLDAIVATFKGIVLYGTCAQSHQFVVDVVHE
jgi:hypothetical protein